MIFKPAQLGMAKLDQQELVEDKKSCKKIGPCGVGKKALYLNSFYIDRRYYLPYGSIRRGQALLPDIAGQRAAADPSAQRSR